MAAQDDMERTSGVRLGAWLRDAPALILLEMEINLLQSPSMIEQIRTNEVHIGYGHHILPTMLWCS